MNELNKSCKCTPKSQIAIVENFGKELNLYNDL